MLFPCQAGLQLCSSRQYRVQNPSKLWSWLSGLASEMSLLEARTHLPFRVVTVTTETLSLFPLVLQPCQHPSSSAEVLISGGGTPLLVLHGSLPFPSLHRASDWKGRKDYPLRISHPPKCSKLAMGEYKQDIDGGRELQKLVLPTPHSQGTPRQARVQCWHTAPGEAWCPLSCHSCTLG